MPALLTMPSAQLTGANHQEFLNQAQMALKPHLKLPISFATANNAVLFTVPTLTNGASGLRIDGLYWEVTVAFTGGSASSIGVNASRAPATTNGALLGGTAGDVAATLVATNKYVPGTIGPAFATGAVTTGKVILQAADTISFQQLVSTFTAGSGFVHIDCSYVD
jgi:hypothetical protein